MEHIQHIWHEHSSVNVNNRASYESTFWVDLSGFELNRPILETTHLSYLPTEFVKWHIVLVQFYM